MTVQAELDKITELFETHMNEHKDEYLHIGPIEFSVQNDGLIALKINGQDNDYYFVTPRAAAEFLGLNIIPNLNVNPSNE